MPKLNKEQIEFIDTYLKNSGVVYDDIRFEMTDHIATALEEMDGDFIDNVRQYMLEHKAGLVKSNRKFVRIAGQRAVKTLGKTLIRAEFIMLFFAGACSITMLKHYVGTEDAFIVMKIVCSFVVGALFLNYRYVIAPRIKYSVADKLLGSVGILFYWIAVIIKPEELISNEAGNTLYHSALLTMLCALYATLLTLIRNYKSQFLK
jgi:hypothetical protein